MLRMAILILGWVRNQARRFWRGVVRAPVGSGMEAHRPGGAVSWNGHTVLLPYGTDHTIDARTR